TILARSGLFRDLGVVVVDEALLDGDGLAPFELILVVLAVVEADHAAIRAEVLEDCRRRQGVILATLALDDGHLVLAVVAVGQRRRRGSLRTERCCRHTQHKDCETRHDGLRGSGQKSQSYFFFFAAAFFAGAFAAGFFAAALAVFAFMSRL